MVAPDPAQVPTAHTHTSQEGTALRGALTLVLPPRCLCPSALALLVGPQLRPPELTAVSRSDHSGLGDARPRGPGAGPAAMVWHGGWKQQKELAGCGSATNLLSLEGVKVVVRTLGWHPGRDSAWASQTEVAGVGAGLARAAEQVGARIWAGATLRLRPAPPAPGQALGSASGQGTLYRELSPQTGTGLSSEQTWASVLHPLGCVDKGPLLGMGEGTGSRVETAAPFPPPQRAGRARRREGGHSQQGPEQAYAQQEQEQEPPLHGLGTPWRGGRAVAETAVAAPAGDPAGHLGLQQPVVPHVGVGAAGGAASAEHHFHAGFCRREEAGGPRPLGGRPPGTWWGGAGRGCSLRGQRRPC